VGVVARLDESCLQKARLVTEDFDPQLFENIAAVQRHCSDMLIRYRCIEAEALRNLAVEYELQSLQALDVSDCNHFAGIAEGLRAAAARLDVAEVPA